MILPGKEIKNRILNDRENGESFDNKLIITPLLSMETQIKDDSASIDLRLGTTFVLSNKFSISHTDPRSNEYNTRESLYHKEFIIGDKLVLHPNQFLLGETLEWIRMPNDLAGLVTAKSSDAREGLQVESDDFAVTKPAK